MEIADLEHNAQRLWFQASNSYVANGDRFEELFGAYNCPLLAKFIFWIRDLFTSGAESHKVAELTLRTLKEMEEQLRNNEPRFVINGDERFGMYPGCPVPGFSYQELATRLIQSQPESQIREEAEKVTKIFNTLPLFSKYQPMPKEYIVNQATGFERPLRGPTFTEQELTALQKDYVDSVSRFGTG